MKKIVFLTGTRADFGKLKSLIRISQNSEEYEVHIFATGMHLNSLYGSTVDEIYKSGFKNIYQYINHDTIEYMDRTMAKTIDGFSRYIKEIEPDLIVIHGDRLEAMAGSIVGSFNNILVAHIEGGEVSGTLDESIRHSVSKLAHIHLVTNQRAKERLIQLGEFKESIFILGSPDLDLMDSRSLPSLEQSKIYYDIPFDNYAIAIFHAVTTEYQSISSQANHFVEALIKSGKNYVVIYPNNDLGSIEILNEYKRLKNNPNFRVFPSLRFENFLTLLKNSDFMIGNSSAGLKEAPFYKIPTIDIGSRQKNRANLPSVIHSENEMENILSAIHKISDLKKDSFFVENENPPERGKSDQIFLNLLDSKKIWDISCQKQFQPL